MESSALLGWLSERLVTLGPGVLFVICLLETAIFAGLILPVGAMIAFAAMLASRGVFSPTEVAMVALSGAFIGDQLGFAVGRWFIAGARPAAGDMATVWQRALGRTEQLIRGRGSLGVTVARTIPFVRTVMPWFAGRSGIPWPKFAIFDLLGVLLWGSIYIGGGFLAGESWRHVADNFGEVAGAVLVVLLIVAVAFGARVWARRALERRRSGVRVDAG